MYDEIKDNMPCIDPKAQAEYEKRMQLVDSILNLLTGKSYSEANSILEQCTWDIKNKAIIK